MNILCEYTYAVFISFIIGFLAGLLLIYCTVTIKKLLHKKKKGFKEHEIQSPKADSSVLGHSRQDHSSKTFK